MRNGIISAGLNHAAHILQQEIITIHNTKQALKHYFEGNGEPVNLGDETIQSLLDSTEFKYRDKRIKEGLGDGKVTSKGGNFGVDLKWKIFHVGDTPVQYSVEILPNGKAQVTYILFAGDGFWDYDIVGETIGIATPDGPGPNLEHSRGTPYYYNPVIKTYIFENPGY